jgi:hypothetical protein
MAQQKRFVNAESLKLVVCGGPASSHSVIKVLTGKTKASHGKKANSRLRCGVIGYPYASIAS